MGPSGQAFVSGMKRRTAGDIFDGPIAAKPLTMDQGLVEIE
jgi:hypothetical protein